MGFFFQRIQNEFETAAVFEPLKFYCIYSGLSGQGFCLFAIKCQVLEWNSHITYIPELNGTERGLWLKILIIKWYDYMMKG